MVALKIEPVNLTPRTYVRGFGALPAPVCVPSTGRPRQANRLSFDLEPTFDPISGRALDRWCGVKIPDDLAGCGKTIFHASTGTHERKICNVFNTCSVRPELVEG
jgi:hypothetical protein